MQEAVSPELALVDPELSRRLRREVPPPLYVALPRPERPQEPALAAVDLAPQPRTLPIRKAIRTVALGIGCVAMGYGGFAAAVAATGHGSAGEPPAVTGTASPRPESAVGAVQRALLAELPAAVRAGRLPPGLLDPDTGLVRNGSAASCVPAAPGYRCTLDAGVGRRFVVLVSGSAGALRIEDVTR